MEFTCKVVRLLFRQSSSLKTEKKKKKKKKKKDNPEFCQRAFLIISCCSHVFKYIKNYAIRPVHVYCAYGKKNIGRDIFNPKSFEIIVFFFRCFQNSMLFSCFIIYLGRYHM